METDATLERSIPHPPSSVPLAPEARKYVVVKRFMENRLAVAGLVVIVVLYAVALAAPFISRYDYDAIQSGMRDKPPSAEHWLGTDRSGRDVYARLIKGGQVSLAAGFAAVVLIMTIGVALGAGAGFFGGWVDAAIMRFTDILLSVPQILLLITAASLFPASLATTVIVIGLSSWPGAARLVRGQFLTLKEQEFVTAARAIGASPTRIMTRHLFPNAFAITSSKPPSGSPTRSCSKRASATSGLASKSPPPPGATCSKTASASCSPAPGG